MAESMRRKGRVLRRNWSDFSSIFAGLDAGEDVFGFWSLGAGKRGGLA
jgi:hypothetical protein